VIRLSGGRVALDSRRAVPANIDIENGRIHRVIPPESSESSNESPAAQLDLENYILLPGLINAHDHLEFNLFPRLGNGPYPNYEEWANDIYRPEHSPLREHLSIPKDVRLWWGGIKNLLCGVTTVCHHNPYEKVFDGEFPIRVLKRYGWAHSIAFEKDVPLAFRSTETGAPFIIHLAEGTDARSKDEIFLLNRLGALDCRTVIVHGVGLTTEGHVLRRQKGASLVWCPTSNRFTIGATIDARSICLEEKVALGSDSALTAMGDLLDEIRTAHNGERVAADEIYAMVTESAAAILRLNDGEGRIQVGSTANLIAFREQGTSPAETLVHADLSQIELVMVAGKPQLVSAEMAGRWPQALLEGFEWISVGGTRRMIRAPICRLMDEVSRRLSGPVRLAGKEVSI
jgi:cytosine/adenosine deaminase-related metal-dependent hydrolase